MAIVAGMVMLAYASVPLYQMFCQVTGLGGTTQRALKPSDVVLARKVTVRFDANVSPKLGWKFEPVQRTVEANIGENVLVFYRATNISDKTIKGTATFNVAPFSQFQSSNRCETSSGTGPTSVIGSSA